MPFWRNYYHLVWATKRRAPLLDRDVEGILCPYLIKKARENGVHVYAVNGWVDHVHLVVAIPPSLSVATVVKRLKGASSHYLNQVANLSERFRWQRGYGALTVGERQLPRVEAYVRRQKEHHREQTTNSWLERVDDLAEEPQRSAVTPGTLGE